MHRRDLIALSTLLPLSAIARQQRALKISTFADGTVRADAKEVDLSGLDKLLSKLKQDEGVVWYYRENPTKEPHPRALEVVKLIVKHALPVSMSTRPDFSDYVDTSGNSKPRQ